MSERIIITGASIAGLVTALALRQSGHHVYVLERDNAPPVEPSHDAFTSWKRAGVPQLRHSHGFLARLRNELRERYPALHTALLDAGAQERYFGESLPPILAPRYRPHADDDDLTTLMCRRTTFESVLHQYARTQGIDVTYGVRVTGIHTEPTQTIPRVTGLTVERVASDDIMPADIVIDATGRRSPFSTWLRTLPLAIEEETADTGIIYYTRFYRLRSGQDEPTRTSHSSMGDLGYLKFGVFPADNHTFSLTLAVPTIETDLRILRHNDAFTTACRALPALAPWLDPDRADPTTDVFAMGGLRSCHRQFVRHGQPLILGYFAVGEAAIHTNPLYGRGCSLSFLHAHLLADVLTHSHDPAARALLFHRTTERELRPFFDEALRQDRRGLQRARQGMQPHQTPPLLERLMRAVVRRGLIPALRKDLTIRRAFMRDFHMLDLPGVALRRPSVVLRILRVLLQRTKHKEAFYPPSSGPDRTTMRYLLELDCDTANADSSSPANPCAQESPPV